MARIKLLFGRKPRYNDRKLKVSAVGACDVPTGANLYSVHPQLGKVTRHALNEHQQAYINPEHVPFVALNDMNARRKAQLIVDEFWERLVKKRDSGISPSSKTGMTNRGNMGMTVSKTLKNLTHAT